MCIRDRLKRAWESADGRDVMQLIVPRSKVQSVLKEVHDGTSGGHLGVKKPLDKIRKRFYWLHPRYGVEEWVRTCEICAASKGPQTRSNGKMRQYNVGPVSYTHLDVYKRQGTQLWTHINMLVVDIF